MVINVEKWVGNESGTGINPVPLVQTGNEDDYFYLSEMPAVSASATAFGDVEKVPEKMISGQSTDLFWLLGIGLLLFVVKLIKNGNS